MAFELFKYNSSGEPQNNFGGESGKRFAFNNEVESYLDDMKLTRRADGSYFLTCSSMVIMGKEGGASTNVGLCIIDADAGELLSGDAGQFITPFALPVTRTVFHTVDKDNEDIYIATELGVESLYGVIKLTNRQGFLELMSGYGGSNYYKSSFAETVISEVEGIALVEVGTEKKLIVAGETYMGQLGSDTAKHSKKVVLQRFNTDGSKDTSYGLDDNISSIVIQDHPMDRGIGSNSNLVTSNENILSMTSIKEEDGEHVILAGVISDNDTRLKARAGLLMKFDNDGKLEKNSFGPDRQVPGEPEPMTEYNGYAYIHAQQTHGSLPLWGSATIFKKVLSHGDYLLACGQGEMEAIDEGISGNIRNRNTTIYQALVVKTFSNNGNLVGSANLGGFGKNGIVYIGFESTIDLVPKVSFNNFDSYSLCNSKGGGKYCTQISSAASMVVDSKDAIIVGIVVQHASVRASDTPNKALQEVLLCKIDAQGKIDKNFGGNGTGAVRVKQYIFDPNNTHDPIAAPLVGLDLQIDENNNIYLGVKERRRVGTSSVNNPMS